MRFIQRQKKNSTKQFGLSTANHIDKQMRLRKNQQQAIRKTVREIFGPDAAVYVFGSRVDDSARGGDIDLLVQLEKPEYTACCMSKWITKVW